MLLKSTNNRLADFHYHQPFIYNKNQYQIKVSLFYLNILSLTGRSRGKRIPNTQIHALK